MRIALVHMRHAGTGGTERYMNLLAKYLAERGHEVTIICRTHEAPNHPSLRFVVLRNFFYIGSAWRMWAFARAVERYLNQHRDQYDVVFSLGKTWTHDVIRLGGGSQDTYLEIGHAPTQNILGRLLGPGIKYRLGVSVERRALAPGAFRRIITNSEWVKGDITRRYGIPREAVSVVYNGVDLDRFHPRHRSGSGAELRRQFGYAESDFVVLFLGTNYARKGLDQVIRVFPAFASAHPDARLLVVGYDSAQSRYKSMAQSFGVAERVRFLGGRRDAEACFGASDLYVIPTHFDPFANSTLEALATGLPVITTISNGGSEVLVQDVHGSIIATDDELLKAMEYWYPRSRSPQVREAIRAQAEKFPADAIARQSEAVLEEVLREKQGGAVPPQARTAGD